MALSYTSPFLRKLDDLSCFSRSIFRADRSLFLDLPMDIIVLILDRLTIAERVCLALTCRGLCKSLFPRGFYPNNLSSRVGPLLEKDVPGLFYCHVCAKLHGWQTGIDRHCRSKSINVFGGMNTRYKLPYLAARLLVNNSIYGPSHRFPIHNIEENQHFTFPYSKKYKGIDYSQFWRVKVIDGELYVKTTYIITHRRSADLWYFLQNHRIWICSHMRFYHADSVGVLLPRFQGNRTLTMFGKWQFHPPEGPASTMCSRCHTDATTVTLRLGRHHVTTIDAYRRLGPCRDLQDGPLRQLSEFGRRELNTETLFNRNAWLRAEAIEKEANKATWMTIVYGWMRYLGFLLGLFWYEAQDQKQNETSEPRVYFFRHRSVDEYT